MMPLLVPGLPFQLLEGWEINRMIYCMGLTTSSGVRDPCDEFPEGLEDRPRYLAVGSAGWGSGRECGRREAADVIDAVLDMGINSIDTADAYGNGVAEEVTGARSRVCTTTD